MSKCDIIHIDMDAFYASIEQNFNPELKGKPVAVCGSINLKGVVSTASYEAREFGVKSAMPVKTALKLCPHLILVEMNFELYNRISKGIEQICAKYTPDYEKASIDEFYLDVSGSHLLFGSTEKIALKIKEEIKKQFNLTCSIGIGPNKILAKIASDLKKPDGMVIINKENLFDIIDNLPVEKIPGVGQKTKELLNKFDIYTIKDLRLYNVSKLKKLLGILGIQFYLYANGIDNSRVLSPPYEKEKSISNELTFDSDTNDYILIHKILLSLATKVGMRLRERNLMAKTIKIKVKYFDFKTIMRQVTLKKYTDITEEIFEVCNKMIQDLIIKPVRLIGVSVSNFRKREDDTQFVFFNFNEKKLYKMNKTVDKIKKNFGDDSIKPARLI